MSRSKKDYYSILGIKKNATQFKIKEAYKKLAFKWHPDKWSTKSPQEKERAEKMFKEIGEAFEVLSNQNQKWNYDRSDKTNYSDGKEGPEFECAGCHNQSTYHYQEITRRGITHIFCSYLCLFDCTNPQCISGGKCYLKFIKPKTGGIFCQDKCYWNFTKTEEEAKNHSPSFGPNQSIDKNCFQCGKEFWQKDKEGKTLSWYPEEDESKKFCSSECIKKWRSHRQIESSRSESISAINSCLSVEPKITTEELEPTNRNWAVALQNATKEEEIESIKSAILEDIRKKRVAKLGKSKIRTLLESAKTKNDFEELFSLIKQLKGLTLTEGYQEYRAEIEEQEERLKKIDPQKYKERINGSLDEQIKNHGLTKQELSAETIAAMEEAERTGEPEKVKFAEELIAVDNSTKCLNQLLTRISQTQTKSEKQELLNQLLIFIEENDFNQRAYHKKKSEVDKIVNQLIRETSTKPNVPEDFPYLPIFLLLGAALVVGASCFLIWKRKKRGY